MHLLNFYVLHGSAMRFLRGGVKYQFCKQRIAVSNTEGIFEIG